MGLRDRIALAVSAASLALAAFFAALLGRRRRRCAEEAAERERAGREAAERVAGRYADERRENEGIVSDIVNGGGDGFDAGVDLLRKLAGKGRERNGR